MKTILYFCHFAALKVFLEAVLDTLWNLGAPKNLGPRENVYPAYG